MPHSLTSPTSSLGVPFRPPLFTWHPSLSPPHPLIVPRCPSASTLASLNIPCCRLTMPCYLSHPPAVIPQHPLLPPHNALSSLAPSLGHPQRSLILDKSLDLNQRSLLEALFEMSLRSQGPSLPLPLPPSPMGGHWQPCYKVYKCKCNGMCFLAYAWSIG